MPSPIEMTVPTSATSTSTAKLPIWSRMILEISSALMSMLVPALRDATLVRPPFAEGVLRRLRSLAARQALAHLCKLRGEAAVVHDAADAGDESAKDRRVDFRRERHVPPGGTRQPVPQFQGLLR